MSAPQSVISGGNLFSRIIYPNHTVVADEEASGHEAFRIATGRRSLYTNYWESITANAQRTITLTADRVRTANLFALDRGHSLAGKEVILECSDDNFTTTQTVFDIVLPVSTAPGSLDDALGVRTEEGAWLKRFPSRAAKYWRLRIPALGAGLKPKIVGAHLSLSFGFDPYRPTAPDADELYVEESVSDAGWRGSSAPSTIRADTLKLQFATLFDYDTARDAFQHFLERRPTWYVPDDSQAQNACCIIRPAGQHGFSRDPDWFYHRANIPFLEHEAARV
jgi:hypothetical protein